jgi:hypothetical protein
MILRPRRGAPPNPERIGCLRQGPAEWADNLMGVGDLRPGGVGWPGALQPPAARYFRYAVAELSGDHALSAASHPLRNRSWLRWRLLASALRGGAAPAASFTPPALGTRGGVRRVQPVEQEADGPVD